MLTQHEVGSEVASGPRFEQGRRVGTEFDEEIAQLLTLECVERDPHDEVADGCSDSAGWWHEELEGDAVRVSEAHT